MSSCSPVHPQACRPRAALWLALSITWRLTYAKDPLWKGPVVCGAMLALIFGIALGGGALTQGTNTQGIFDLRLGGDATRVCQRPAFAEAACGLS